MDRLGDVTYVVSIKMLGKNTMADHENVLKPYIDRKKLSAEGD